MACRSQQCLLLCIIGVLSVNQQDRRLKSLESVGLFNSIEEIQQP